MNPTGRETGPRETSPRETGPRETGRTEILRIAGRTLFYFILLVAILLLWEGRGLFIYENF